MPKSETFLFAEPEAKPTKDQHDSDLTRELQKLHDWLQHNWTKPTVNVRDIYRLGPRSIRNWKKLLSLTKILVGHGWLIPIKSWRYDMHEWQIIRAPDGYPTIATMTPAARIETPPAKPPNSL